MKLTDEQLNAIIDKADDDLDRLKDRCHELYEENERLKEELENKCWDEASVRADILLEQDDYKSRCEKAIEFIKEKARNNCWIDQYEASDLLNILQNGSDDNE